MLREKVALKRQEAELEVAELRLLQFSTGGTRRGKIRNDHIRSAQDHSNLTWTSLCRQMGGRGESLRESLANSMCSPPPTPLCSSAQRRERCCVMTSTHSVRRSLHSDWLGKFYTSSNSDHNAIAQASFSSDRQMKPGFPRLLQH